MEALAQVRMLDRGECLFAEGTPPEYWYGLSSGILAMRSTVSAHPSYAPFGLAPGGWVGEEEILRGDTFSYRAVALRKSIVLQIPAHVLRLLAETSAAFSHHLLVQINDRIGRIRRFSAGRYRQDTDARVACLLSELLVPGGGEFGGHRLTITQQELASLANISRQRTNEALQVLQRRGNLKVNYGNILVLNVAGLRASATVAD